ncbi:hypothetical protein HK105_207828 [Polyrhizophydium stewartii]|uniref:Pentatricopeptide repeat-containing protein n=1 Tax=Polyrhizophydium stewartii TaxID=2732419 RepID=A0ABR4MZL1_9FUNG|nr:hypothetical protein HK105_002275 [Polyrhizophydium stewartii]
MDSGEPDEVQPAVTMDGLPREAAEQLKKLQKELDKGRRVRAVEMFSRLDKMSAKATLRLLPRQVAKLMFSIVYTAHLDKEYSVERRLRLVKRVWQVAHERGGPISERLWRMYIDMHARTGDVEIVTRLLETMRIRGHDVTTVEMLLIESRAYFVAGREERGLQIWRTAQEKDRTARPYVHLLSTLILSGRPDRAVQLLEIALEEVPSFEAARGQIHSLCTQLAQRHDYAKVAKIARMLAGRAQLPQDFEWEQAAMQLMARKDFERALHILEAMRGMQLEAKAEHVDAEIVIRELMRQHTRLPELFSQSLALSPRLRLSSTASLVLVKVVGAVESGAQLDELLATHGILVRLGAAVSLESLLRGYVSFGGAESAGVVLGEIARRRIAVPQREVEAAVELVARQCGGETALAALEAVIGARMAVDGGRVPMAMCELGELEGALQPRAAAVLEALGCGGQAAQQ